MSVHTYKSASWQRRSVAGVFALVVLSPLFAWAAERVGYAEPMENAATLAGAASQATPTSISVFSGYVLPGVGPHLGTLAGGLLGSLLTLGLALAVGHVISHDA